jgi:hypothetical protein
VTFLLSQSARQLLTLPSQQQAQRALQDKLLLMGLGGSAGSGGLGPYGSVDSAASLSKCLPPNPLADERSVCAYAFDVSAPYPCCLYAGSLQCFLCPLCSWQLVDSGGEGIVPLHRLVQCLQSLEFSRVVATSLALSTIFHGGSHAALHGASAAPSKQGQSASPAVALAGGTADIPSLLPVFIDTFSAPSQEAAEEQGEHKQHQQQHQSRQESSAQDWISKLDFLEFCSVVTDLKRYSAVAPTQQQQ